MRTRMLLTAALAVVIGIAAAGCGGGSSSGEAPPEETTPADTGGTQGATGEGSEEIVTGGIARIGTTGQIDSLNPFVGFNAESYVSWLMTYPVLVEYGPGLVMQGDWAESWEISPDGKTWTFTVKEGQWSDGEPLTAADGAWMINTTLKYQDGPTGNIVSYVQGVVEATAPDPTTLVVTFEKAVPEDKFLEGLTQYPILPEHVWSAYETNNGKDLRTYNPQDDLPLVSGGAFVLTRFDKNGVTLYEKNPDFYNQPAYVDAVGYQHFDNEDAMLTALQAGELDYVDEVPQKAVETLQNNEDLVVEIIEGSQVQNFIFNSSENGPYPELRDPKVREALAHAMNRDEIADVVYAGFATPVASMIAPYSKEWVNPALVPEPYDTAIANQMLDEAGYPKGTDGIRTTPDGRKMEYEVVVPQGVVGIQREFEVIQKGFAEAGVRITPAVFDDTTAFEKILGTNGDSYDTFAMSIWDWVGLFDPDFVLSVLLCSQRGNYSDTGYCNPEYDKLYNQQTLETDPEKRKEIVYELQQIIYDDRPYVNLVALQVLTARGKNWSSFQPEIAGYSKLPWTQVHQLAG